MSTAMKTTLLSAPRASTPLRTTLGVAVLALLASCARRPTELWVVVDSNIAITGTGSPRIDAVRITGRTSAMGDPELDVPFSLVGQMPSFALPGHTVIRPDRGGDESRPLTVIVTGELSNREVVRQTARVSFARDRRLVVRMFLAAECVGPRQAECESMGLTCGEGGRCVAVDRPTLEEYGTSTDGGGSDASADAMVSSGTCTTPAAVMLVAGPSAPRLQWPPVGSTATTKNPTVRWQNAMTTAGSRVEFCQDRACTRVIAALDQTGTEARLPCDLPTGTIFFRARALVSPGMYGATASPTWQLRIPAQVTNPMTVADTAHGCDSDFDGDGLADLVVGVRTGATTRLEFFRGRRGMTPAMDRTISMAETYTSIATAGDVDGDGFVDLVLANSGANAARVLFGAETGALTRSATLVRPAAATSFGTSVAGVGDVDGDGYADVLVGAPSSATNVGQAHLFYGSAAPAMLMGVMVAQGTAALEQLGTSVGGGGDINGDRISDFVIGAPFGEPAGVPQNQGQVQSFAGATSRTHRTLGTVTGTSPNAHLGRGVVLGGDSDGDGRADLFGSAPEFQVMMLPMINTIGQVLFQRSNGTALTTAASVLLTGSTTAVVRSNVAHIGDSDGDGFGDALVLGPATNGGATLGLQLVRGAAMRASFAVATVPGVGDEVPTDVMGAIGDCDGDGSPDAAAVFRSSSMMTDRLVLVRSRGATAMTDVVSAPASGTTFEKFARWY